MKRIAFFLMIALVLGHADAFGQKELGAQEAYHYYFRIAKDTAIDNTKLFLDYLNRFYTAPYQKAIANELEREPYLEGKKSDLREQLLAVNFDKPFLIPVFKGEISVYDTEKGGFFFHFPPRDSLARAFSGKTILWLNNIININEFDDLLFLKMDSADAVKFLKSIRKKSAFPDREVRYYCYYSIVNQKLKDIANRNYTGMDRAVDIYLQKIVIKTSNGKKFTFSPKEEFDDPANGFKTLTGKEFYYYKLNSSGDNKEFLCSKTDDWKYYTVVDRKDSVVINPLFTINRNGDTTAIENCMSYYPCAYVLDGTSRYREHLGYVLMSKANRSWIQQTYITNYKNGKLDGVTAWYNPTNTSPTLFNLSLIRMYDNGKVQGYAISSDGDIVNMIYLYNNDREVSRQGFMKSNQDVLPNEVKKVFYKYRYAAN